MLNKLQKKFFLQFQLIIAQKARLVNIKDWDIVKQDLQQGVGCYRLKVRLVFPADQGNVENDLREKIFKSIKWIQ